MKNKYTSECDICKKRFSHDLHYNPTRLFFQHFVNNHLLICFECENKIAILASTFIKNPKKVWNNVRRWKF
jgi:predicted anti-sigma-YlaC factor YlaD